MVHQPDTSRRQAWEPRGGAQPAVAPTRHCGVSDCGPHRARNEDAFVTDERLGLFIVCDGVGGRRAGEVASGEAVAIMHDHVRDALLSGSVGPEVEDIREVVLSAMQRASRELFAMGVEHPRFAGMGATASVMLVVGDVAVIGQVGDTRVYHARGHSTRQLTEDHTLRTLRVQQGQLCGERTNNRRSPITRALGLRDTVEVDIHTARLAPGDRLLLCTDGLHEHLEHEAALLRLFQMHVKDAARAAIEHADMCGRRDNATAIFVEILEHG